MFPSIAMSLAKKVLQNTVQGDRKTFLKRRVKLALRPVIPTTGTIVSHNGTHSFVLAPPQILDKCFQFALDS